MRTLSAIFILAATATVQEAKAQIKAVSQTDGSAVTYASVFKDDGSLAGTTGRDGILSLPKGYAGRVTIQHINYETKEVKTDTLTHSTVLLKPFMHDIPEVSVTAEQPEYVRMTAFVRQYTIVDSIPSVFRESLCDYYIPVKKGKSRMKIRSSRYFMSKDVPENDAVFYELDYPRETGGTLLGRIKKDKRDSILNSLSKGDVRIPDIRGSIFKIRQNRADSTISVSLDSLFTTNDFSFSLFGIRMRCVNRSETETYTFNGHTMPTYKNMLTDSEYLCNYYRFGRLRKEKRFDEFTDIYFLGVSYASKDAAKAASKDRTREPFTMPSGIPPISKPLEEAVSKMKSM